MSKLKCLKKLQKIKDLFKSTDKPIDSNHNQFGYDSVIYSGLSVEERVAITRRDAMDIIRNALDELEEIGIDTEKLEGCYDRFKNDDMSVTTMVGMFILSRINMKKSHQMEGVYIINATIRSLTEASCAEAALNEEFRERAKKRERGREKIKR